MYVLHISMLMHILGADMRCAWAGRGKKRNLSSWVPLACNGDKKNKKKAVSLSAWGDAT
jgi:hypothetical protein